MDCLCSIINFRIFTVFSVDSYGHGDEDDAAVASPENKPRILLMGLRRYVQILHR